MKDKTIFLIDDDIDDQEIFCLALKDVDDSCICIVSDNAIDALEKLNSGNILIPDFIFLDLNMPRMSGQEFLKEIKQNPLLHPIPVIVFTTSTALADIEETRKLGAAHFFTKPSNMRALTNALSGFLKHNNHPFYLNP